MLVNIPIKDEDNYGYIFHLLRMAKNWKVQDVAIMFNVSTTYINILEKSHNMSDKNLKKLCYIYNISRNHLKRIHDISKNKHHWDYQNTLKDILEYYVNKKYFEENY